MLHTRRLGRAHFSLEAHAAAIQSHGTQVAIFPCLTCPCLTDERHFDPNCQSCHGTGRFYPPGQGKDAMLRVQRESSGLTMQEPGGWLPGVIYATLLPEVRLSKNDLIRFVTIKDVFADEILTRGLDDSVRFAAGVELDLVADRQTVYRTKSDYVLEPPNTIVWVEGGHAPPFMSQYSVRYQAHPDYLMLDDTPRNRSEDNRQQVGEVKLLRLNIVMR